MNRFLIAVRVVGWGLFLAAVVTVLVYATWLRCQVGT